MLSSLQDRNHELETMKTVRDTLGEMQIPEQALYGAQTARAIENFKVSALPLPSALLRALAQIKLCWAKVNAQHCPQNKQAMYIEIAAAARSIIEGQHHEQLLVDVYQTGSGTSSNMNINEVLASLASKSSGQIVHPNDDVNRCQSSNDVFPTAMQLACLELLTSALLPAMDALTTSLKTKATLFAKIVKVGRTHLQDATPITLGQEFSAWASQIQRARRALLDAATHLYQLPLGGTATGTGLNAPQALVESVIRLLAQETGQALTEAPDHFEAQSARDGIGIFSSALRSLALALHKIANDIRWLASGPNCGIGELIIPATQPGSSIMPAKINPVQAESVMQVVARVVGNDATVGFALASGNFQLNTMMPVMAYAVIDSASLLANVISNFNRLCVQGIQANEARCAQLVEQNLSLITAVAPVIGYEAAAAIAKQAQAENRTLRDVLATSGLLDPDLIDSALDAYQMTLRPEEMRVDRDS
jgi:fumarate hydratase class II